MSIASTREILDLQVARLRPQSRKLRATEVATGSIGRTSNATITRVASPYNFRLLAVSAAGFCVFLSVYATQSLLPLLARIFHASELHASLTVTATTLAVALAAPAAGLLAERIGRKTVIVSAIFLLAIPTFLASTAHSLNGLIGWRFAQGLIMPGIIAVTMAYVAEEWPADHVATAMSAYVTGNVLAGVIGRFMTGWIASHFGWNWSFLALGVLDLIGGIIVWKGLPPSRQVVVRRPLGASLRDMRQHLYNGGLVATFAVGFSILLVLVATFTYVTYPLAARPFNLGPVGLGSLFLVYLLGVVVTPIGGRLIDRYGHRRCLLIALAAAAAGLACTLVASLTAVVVGLALCSAAIFVCQAATASYMGLIAGKARASAAGLYASFYYLGGAAGAFLPGLFWHLGGWHATVGFLTGMLLLTATIAATCWKQPGGSPQSSAIPVCTNRRSPSLADGLRRE
jgi:predicted MFS family arabinose efflux permease